MSEQPRSQQVRLASTGDERAARRANAVATSSRLVAPSADRTAPTASSPRVRARLPLADRRGVQATVVSQDVAAGGPALLPVLGLRSPDGLAGRSPEQSEPIGTPRLARSHRGTFGRVGGVPSTGWATLDDEEGRLL
jgi:hypothetical protein